MTNSFVQKGTIGIAFAALVLLALMVSPVSVKAADFDFGYDYVGTSYFDYAPAYDYIGTSYFDSPSYGYDYVGTSYYTPSYDYDYVGTSYYTPSYYTPSYFSPSSFSVYTPPVSQWQSQSQSQSQSSTNVNTNNNVNNVVVNVPTTQQPPVVQPPVYDVCPNLPGVQTTVPSGYYLQNGYCYKSVAYNPPVYQAPYVNLSAVPYTGLELGPVGTALYWSFLVLWCLVAAYLIVVKRVQNTILRKLNTFLFGSAPLTASGPVQSAGAVNLSQNDLVALASMLRSTTESTHAPRASALPEQKVDATDDFILNQINRSRN